MLEAGLWGLVGGFALLLGGLLGVTLPVSQRTIGLIMAFGSGVLISALSFELTEEAYRQGGIGAVAGGMAVGAFAFFAGDRAIDCRGGNNRKRSGGEQTSGSPGAIVLGAVMDGIPESVVIGVGLVGGGAVALPVVMAVFMSNVPESLSAAKGLTKAGHSARSILRMWAVVMAVSGLAAALGYWLLGGASENVIATVQAFAAGAILTMLADTMMPEAFEHGGSAAGLVTVLGFAMAFFLSTVE